MSNEGREKKKEVFTLLVKGLQNVTKKQSLPHL